MADAGVPSPGDVNLRNRFNAVNSLSQTFAEKVFQTFVLG
jgi:hypothetical protein